MKWTLQKRILFFNFATFLVALILVGFFAFYEFTEQEDFLGKSDKKISFGSPAFEALEIVGYGGIAALVIAAILARIFLQRTLQPISFFSQQLEKTDITNLLQPVQRSGNGDEIDRLAVVFNRLKERLNLSFKQSREFTMNASHELKTPLTIMHTTIEQMVGDETLANHHREQLDSILEEVERLTRISSQLTFLSKFDSEQSSPSFSPCSMGTLVREMVEDVEVIGSERQIKVETLRCDELMVWGDRMMLRQLLVGLADNAVKYNCDHGVIQVSLEAQGDTAFLEIRNSGLTLPEEMWERIFERFCRVQLDVSAEIEGSGLGLSIARAIVAVHAGSIEYSVTADKMNMIRVRLPREEKICDDSRGANLMANMGTA